MEPNVYNLPNCAVLMAVYNGMQYLAEQLDTILQQTGVNLTVYISVDESTDGSEEWLNSRALKDSRIILLPHGEKFGGAARNFFRLIRDVDLTQHDYIAFSDQDDHWYSDKLAKACNQLKNSKYEAYSSNVMAFWPNGKKVLVNKAQSQRRWDYIFEAAGPGCTYVIHVTLMSAIKDEILKKWSSVQAVGLHDWFFYAYARANNYQWFIDPAPSMLYRQHPKNQLGVNIGYHAYCNRFKQIKNGWWFKQVLLITQLLGVENTPFVKSWINFKRVDFLRLATQMPHCRREFSARAFFLCICLLFAVTGT